MCDRLGRVRSTFAIPLEGVDGSRGGAVEATIRPEPGRIGILGGQVSGLLGRAPVEIEPTTCIAGDPFVLRVLDDSMAPEFQPGCMIVVDPTGRATDGAYVVAEADGGIWLRRLRCEDDQAWLEALNPVFPRRAIGPDLAVIIGVVTQRAGTRRRDHKRYDV